MQSQAEAQQATAGGARHQATAGGNHVTNFVANSLLAAFLVEQVAWGHFSPQLIQKIAALARSEDGQPAAPVAWDCSCLEEVCGSCTMLINGRTRMACSALV